MFHIVIHSILEIYAPDINTNHFDISILLFIVKLNHKHIKDFKQICTYHDLWGNRNMFRWINNHTLEVKLLNYFRNSMWPITSIHTKIHILLLTIISFILQLLFACYLIHDLFQFLKIVWISNKTRKNWSKFNENISIGSSMIVIEYRQKFIEQFVIQVYLIQIVHNLWNSSYSG